MRVNDSSDEDLFVSESLHDRMDFSSDLAMKHSMPALNDHGSQKIP